MNLLSLTRHDDGTFTARWDDSHAVQPLQFNAWHAADGTPLEANSTFRAPALTAEQMEAAVAPDLHPAYALAEKGAAAKPELAQRMHKAAELVHHGHVAILSDGTAWVKQYEIKNGRCTCKDFEFRAPDGWCKHRLAVRMANSLQTAVDREGEAERRKLATAQRIATGKEKIRRHNRKFTAWCNTKNGKTRYAIMAHARGASPARVHHLKQEAATYGQKS